MAVAANGITNANVADGALSPAKIAGTGAILGANIFTGTQLIQGGNAGIGTATPISKLHAQAGASGIGLGAGNRAGNAIVGECNTGGARGLWAAL